MQLDRTRMIGRSAHSSRSRRQLARAKTFVWCVGAAATASLFACSDAPTPVRLDPAATLLVDAPPVAAGNPFEIVLFVRTPAGHRVHGYQAPELNGLEITERHAWPATLKGANSIQRETLMVRSLDAGESSWPPSEIRVTRPGGETYALPLHGLEFDVPSVFGEDAPPPRPRGYRRIPEPRDPTSFALGAATGFLAAGAIALWIVRRRRPLGAARAQAADTTMQPRMHLGGPTRLNDELEAARSRLAQDPDAAAFAASLALRHWAADRFLVSTHARSAEELSVQPPPDASTREWRGWIEPLAELEAARFGPPWRSPGYSGAVARAIDRALDFAHSLDGHPAPGAPAE